MADKSSLQITIGVDDKSVKANLQAIGESVKRLGLMTETAFSKANMAVLGVKAFSEIRAEMSRTTQAYRDLASSGKLSATEQAKALEALRKKQRELYASMSGKSGLASAREALGLTAHKEIAGQIEKLRAAYRTLAASGKLSMAELAHAKVAMGQRIDELRNKTNGWRDALGEIKGKALEAAAALAGIFYASKKALEFESAMADVKKVVDATPQEIAALSDELQRMTREIPLAADQLAAIAASGGQLGISAQDIGAFVDVVAKMSTAFDMLPDAAGEALGKIKTVFGLNIEELRSFGDAVNQLGNNTASTEKNIIDVMLRIGGTAKQFGLAKEGAAALASTMLSLGKTPEVAATSINALLLRMQAAESQSNDFKDALHAIGTSAEELATSVEKNPQKAINDLLNTLSKLQGRDRANILSGLFGREYQDDIATLLGGLGEYQKALVLIGDKSKYAGAMTKEFEARSQTGENQLQLMKNAFVEIATNIGDGFLPAIKAVAWGITEILKPVAELTNAFPKVSAAMLGVGTGAIVFSTVVRAVEIAKMAFLGLGIQATATAGTVGVAARAINASFRFAFLPLAAFAAGYEISVIAQKLLGIKTAAQVIREETDKWAKGQNSFVDAAASRELDEINRRLGTVYQSMDELFAAEKRGEVVFDQVAGAWKKASAEMVDGYGEVAAASDESAGIQLRVSGEALKEMEQQYKKYVDQIKRLQDEIAGRERSLYEKLRAMARSGMSELGAWKDRRREAELYYQTAQRAAKAGNTDEAVKYADMAQKAYEDLNKEVKDGETVQISQADALKVAMAGVKKAGELAIKLLHDEAEAARDAANELNKQSGMQLAPQDIQLLTGETLKYQTAVKDTTKSWETMWETVGRDGRRVLETIAGEIRKLDGSTITIYTKHVEKKQAGGPIGRFARGGRLPGFGGGDRIHALLEAGEFVMRKEAVAKFGAGIFHMLNSLKVPALPRFATGGPVGSVRASNDGPVHLIDLRTSDTSRPVRVQTDQAGFQELLRWQAERLRFASS